mmetsp:Transcript_8647/g.17722  ORF Transcript_8647/g.17722 Transcript_8647/m.17722 type:complete len:127 (+) Transcript_8647:649-1029(+)
MYVLDHKDTIVLNTMPYTLVVFKEDTDDWVSVNLFVHHEAKDTHHGGTSVVQFNGTLSKLGLGAKIIPAEVNEPVTEITREFTCASNILHDKEFQQPNEEDNLSETSLRNGIRARDSRKAIWVLRK